MNRLYPRLLPSATAARFRQLQETGPQPPKDGEVPSLAEAVYAATGGTRTSPLELLGIRTTLLQLASSYGFPTPLGRSDASRFDVETARYLHSSLLMAPGEAAQRQVWSYFGLVLVPDVCAWRYPPNQTRGHLDDRFIGADLTRHTLSKLWLRAHLLHEPGTADPYGLLDVLGEADVDQILARRLDVAATPALVREVIRAYRDDPGDRTAPNNREVLRDSLKRLMRLSAFTNLDGLTQYELAAVVLEARARSRHALAGEP
jgi:hypothetical protein